jgi:hypothetical protein
MHLSLQERPPQQVSIEVVRAALNAGVARLIQRGVMVAPNQPLSGCNRARRGAMGLRGGLVDRLRQSYNGVRRKGSSDQVTRLSSSRAYLPQQAQGGLERKVGFWKGGIYRV